MSDSQDKVFVAAMAYDITVQEMQTFIFQARKPGLAEDEVFKLACERAKNFYQRRQLHAAKRSIGLVPE